MKKISVLFFCVLFLLTVSVTAAHAEEVSGSCGEDATWTMTDYGALVISGTGTVTKGDWDPDEVYELVIEEGITVIGPDTFTNLKELSYVSLPGSLTVIEERAFQGSGWIQTVAGGTSLVSIGEDAFNGCCFLDYIELTDTLEEIGARAFRETGFSEFEIPASVTSIGQEAFAECGDLYEIVFMGDPPVIGKNAMLEVQCRCVYVEANSNWTDDVMADYGGELYWTPGNKYGMVIRDRGACGPNATWTIDGHRRVIISGTGTVTQGDWDPEEVQNVEIENGITGIDATAFTEIPYLISVDIADTVESIPAGAFEGCSNLSEVTLPSKLGYLPDRVFKGTNLNKITIPLTVQVIGNEAFANCENLEKVTFLGEPPAIQDDSFLKVKATCLHPLGCTLWCDTNRLNYGGKLKWMSISDEGTVIALTGTCGENLEFTLSLAGTLTISGTGPMDDYVFTFPFGYNAPWKGNRFEGITYYIENIVIEEGVTYIGEGAFYWCGDVKTVTLPSTLKTIGKVAFFETNIPSITVPEGVETIGMSAFNGCDELKEVVLPDSLITIGEYAFANCTALEKLTMGKNVQNIEPYAFLYCTSLRSIELPQGLTQISERALSSVGLTSIDIPDSVTTIGDYALNSTNLETIVVPEGVTSIGECAFFNNEQLKSLWLPDSVKEINNDLLTLCSSLENVRLPATLTRIPDGTFSSCQNLSCLVVPESVTSIGRNAFVTAPGLKLVFMGDVPTIGDTLGVENAVVYYTPGANTANQKYYGSSVTWQQMYAVAEGAGSAVKPGEAQTVTVRADCGSDRAQWVRLDGFLLEESNYTISADGTAVTLNEAYVAGLKEGEYTLVIGYGENLCATTLTVDADAQKQPEEEIVWGDATGEGIVDYMDAMMVLRHAVKLATLSEEAQARCNVDGQGGIDYMDAMLILRKAVKLINKFPVEK